MLLLVLGGLCAAMVLAIVAEEWIGDEWERKIN